MKLLALDKVLLRNMALKKDYHDMKAIIAKQLGPPENLVIEELEALTPGAGQVVVDNRAAAINFPDLLVMEGKYQVKPPLPFSPGKESAGIVKSIGAGDRVMVQVEYGTYAQEVLAEEAQCYPVPKDISFEEAAAIGIAYQTAHFALVARAHIKEGNTVLVTGASSGLGEHFSEVLAKAGAAVTLSARRLERVQEKAEALCRKGYQAEALKLDVTDNLSVTRAFSADPYDVVVNNAGISGSGRAVDMKAEEFESVLQTNLTGVFAVAQAAAQQMSSRGGSIINIASILGLRVAGQVAAYAASKAGIFGLTKSLAKELGSRNITVNAIAPGYVQTSMTEKLSTNIRNDLYKNIPLKRLGSAEDIANLVLFLSSEKASYITGQIMNVDGGMVT